jgi:hypothetical protein
LFVIKGVWTLFIWETSGFKGTSYFGSSLESIHGEGISTLGDSGFGGSSVFMGGGVGVSKLL